MKLSNNKVLTPNCKTVFTFPNVHKKDNYINSNARYFNIQSGVPLLACWELSHIKLFTLSYFVV